MADDICHGSYHISSPRVKSHLHRQTLSHNLHIFSASAIAASVASLWFVSWFAIKNCNLIYKLVKYNDLRMNLVTDVSAIRQTTFICHDISKLYYDQST